jgi:hypothetical protein
LTHRASWPKIRYPESVSMLSSKFMSQNLNGKSVGSLKRRSRMTILVLVIPLGLLFLLVFQVIPPVTGRVVDAVTGKSIRGVRLTLEMSHYEQWSVYSEVNGSAKSGAIGWFFLFGTLRWRGLPLSTAGPYWLTVNEADYPARGEEISAEIQFMRNPMPNWRDSHAGDRGYFPLVVSSRHYGCNKLWEVTCIYKPFAYAFPIRLIPVQEDINDCQKIESPVLRENRRQPNT